MFCNQHFIKWIKFTYYSPSTHKVTKLLKNTDLNVAFRTSNTIYNQLCDMIPLSKINSSGIHKLQCKSVTNHILARQEGQYKYDTVNIYQNK